MLNLAAMMRLAADAVENYETKVNEARDQGTVNGTSVLDALVTLGAGASIAAQELINKLPRPTTPFTHDANSDVSTEVEQIVGLLGLVQEEELAALRKRVVELEKLVRTSAAKSPAAKKAPAKKPAPKKSAK